MSLGVSTWVRVVPENYPSFGTSCGVDRCGGQTAGDSKLEDAWREALKTGSARDAAWRRGVGAGGGESMRTKSAGLGMRNPGQGAAYGNRPLGRSRMRRRGLETNTWLPPEGFLSAVASASFATPAGGLKGSARVSRHCLSDTSLGAGVADRLRYEPGPRSPHQIGNLGNSRKRGPPARLPAEGS